MDARADSRSADLEFVAADGSCVRLRLLGRQFPRVTSGPDAGWLLVHGQVEMADETWEFVEPSLEITDVHWIVRWLDQLARGDAKEERLEFNEPELALHSRADLGPTGFALQLDRHAKPPSRKPGLVGDDPLVLEFAPSSASLRAAATRLRRRLEEVER